ncbi:tryptophan--tRNA ligase [Sphingobium sp. Ant17]|jgi:tryptophanyl-tRNA synthetase|uniref:tryptophan--tRNA ligase n=1 Tax=Sphingobium sp. Ant17 TaxID=1461752 RepID=UPI000451BCA7|nr:tryptophan--tRNA ligase [Sphingobium sp. Ant17]EXS70205.1 tryptophanyl-tRNA synthetase [Sphingobium sp. Ant17]|tara:strand:- start:3863 stop:4867 length:1005 start_codon:yes stop_codon:yes gene_type:complete
MRVLSGIQPTGNLHLGNYLGAIRNWVKMQDEMDADSQCFFFLADMHSITVHEAREQRIRNVRDMAAALVAAGIDPDRSVLFNQARVPAHAELCWLLNGTARIGWLNRMTQFKDKAGKDREGASVGLFVYPVLQAADILAYNATHVPVGEDQKQHLELARDIAAKFNSDFGVDLFTLPDPIIPKESARIMSLRDGSAKMSKSDPSDMSRINLTDDDDAIMAKVKKAKSDQEMLPETAASLTDRPEARNLVGILATLTGRTPDAVCAEFAGRGFGAFKPALGEVLVETLRPIRQRFLELRTDDAALDAILDKGAAKAAAAAEPTLRAAYDAMGLMR